MPATSSVAPLQSLSIRSQVSSDLATAFWQVLVPATQAKVPDLQRVAPPVLTQSEATPVGQHTSLGGVSHGSVSMLSVVPSQLLSTLSQTSGDGPTEPLHTSP